VIYGGDLPPVAFEDIGIKQPIALSQNNGSFSIAFPELSGCRPAGGTLWFRKAAPDLKIVLSQGKDTLYSGSPDGEGKVSFTLSSDPKMPLVLHGAFSQGGEGIDPLWLDPASEVRYSENQAIPIYRLFGGKGRDLAVKADLKEEKGVQAALNIASQIGALYFPWRFNAVWESSAEGAIVLGNFSKPFEEKGGSLYVDAAHITELNRYLLGVEKEPSPHKPLMISSEGDETWKWIFPFAFSEGGNSGYDLHLHLLLSNAGSEPVPLTVEMDGIVRRKIILPPDSKDVPFAISFSTQGLSNSNYIALGAEKGGKGVTLSEQSFIEFNPGEIPAVMKLKEVGRLFSGKGDVLLSDLKEGRVKMALSLVEYLARRRRLPSAIELHLFHPNGTLGEGDWTLFVGSSLDLSALSPLVDVNWPFETRSGFINAVLFPRGEEWAQQFLQIFWNERPILAYTDLSGTYDAWMEREKFERALKFPSPFALRKKGEWTTIDFSRRFPPLYLDRFRIEVWWQHNKMWVVLVLIALTALFLKFIWKTLTYKQDL
jgi:hypothetical protein